MFCSVCVCVCCVCNYQEVQLSTRQTAALFHLCLLSVPCASTTALQDMRHVESNLQHVVRCRSWDAYKVQQMTRSCPPGAIWPQGGIAIQRYYNRTWRRLSFGAQSGLLHCCHLGIYLSIYPSGHTLIWSGYKVLEPIPADIG